jgi:hypothetical protein
LALPLDESGHQVRFLRWINAVDGECFHSGVMFTLTAG